MTKVNTGNDSQSRAMASTVALSGTNTTAPAATTIKLDDQGAPGSTSAWNGQVVVRGSVFGVVQSNTNVAAPVVTIDQWYNANSVGGAAAATPAAGGYVLLPGGMPAFFMAITANSTAPAAGDTTLASEITTASGGLVRKLCPYAHTAGAASYTLTPVYTANASDALPVTIAKVGVFVGPVVAASFMEFETLLPTTATLSATGDQLTITETVTL